MRPNSGCGKAPQRAQVTQGQPTFWTAKELAMVPPGTPGITGFAGGVDPYGQLGKGMCLPVTVTSPEGRYEANCHAYKVARFVSATLWLVAASEARGPVGPQLNSFCLAAYSLGKGDAHPLVTWACHRLGEVEVGAQGLDALDHMVSEGLV